MNRLNIFAITVAMLLCTSAAPSHAQDRSSYSWTGCYLGGHAGGGRGTSDPDINLIPANKMQGFIGGAQTGYNYQFATNWLVGAVRI